MGRILFACASEPTPGAGKKGDDSLAGVQRIRQSAALSVSYQIVEPGRKIGMLWILM
jgi:hypothetical protein